MQQHSKRCLVAVGVMVLVTSGMGCTSTKSPGPQPDDGIYNPYKVPLDPLNVVRSASIAKDGQSQAAETVKILSKNIYIDRKSDKKEDDGGEARPVSKISPVLQ